MLIRGRTIFTALLLLAPCLAGCQESGKLDDAAKARIAHEQAAADDLKKRIGEEQYEKLASDGDEDGGKLPPRAVLIKEYQAKRAGGQSKKSR